MFASTYVNAQKSLQDDAKTEYHLGEIDTGPNV